MKRCILFVISLVISTLIFAQEENQHEFYVGAYTSAGAEGIYLCSFSSETGEIKLEKSFSGIENPSFVKLSPNNNFLYAVSEAGDKGSFVYAYKVDDDKNLTLLNKQSSNGNGPCYVDVSGDGKFVAAATYGGGTTSLYPVMKNGALKKASTVMVNEGSNVNEKRQNKPHAHSIKFSPYNNLIFSADLGTDHLDIYELKKGKMKKSSPAFVKVPDGAGPRHFDFHPKKEQIYVINELNSSISVLQQVSGNWKVVQNISTLPTDFDGVSYCADIHISRDGKFLYGSNRGHNSIAVFKIDSGLKLNFIETVPVAGDWPRNFGLTPDGKWMLVANQKSNDITVFKINTETGMPKFTGKKLSLPSPVCIEFL